MRRRRRQLSPRVARLALAESLLLSLTAGGVGLLAAFTLLRTFVGMAPANIFGIAEASIDVRVFVVAALLVVFTGVAIGLWPAISVFRVSALQGLRSKSISTPGARPRMRFALVTMQIALTLALLGGSALLLRSLWNANLQDSHEAPWRGGHVVTLAIWPKDCPIRGPATP
jgi:hypothetical protein